MKNFTKLGLFLSAGLIFTVVFGNFNLPTAFASRSGAEKVTRPIATEILLANEANVTETETETGNVGIVRFNLGVDNTGDIGVINVIHIDTGDKVKRRDRGVVNFFDPIDPIRVVMGDEAVNIGDANFADSNDFVIVTEPTPIVKVGRNKNP